MTTLFTLGAPIGLWLHAIRTAQKERFIDDPIVKEWKPTTSMNHAIRTAQKERFINDPIVKEWKPTTSMWGDIDVPPPPPNPLVEVLVTWDPELS